MGRLRERGADNGYAFQSTGESGRWRDDGAGRNQSILPHRIVCPLRILPRKDSPMKLTLGISQSVIIGCYVIIFGLGVSIRVSREDHLQG